jgi:hypothetical protein
MASPWFVVGIAATVLLLAVGHWFPWPRKLRRLESYTYGTGCLLAGQAVWLAGSGQLDIWLGLLIFGLAGGLVTVLAYSYDLHRNTEVNRKAVGDERDPRD